MDKVSEKAVHQAYILLRIAFVAAPIVAGLDKFFDFLVDWDMYLVPFMAKMGHWVMYVVGVIEIIAGLGVIFRPTLFANIVGIWLIAIILNLLMLGGFYDIALRDLGLCLGAFALGRLAKAFS